ncbi:glycoside hydrolase family 38 C-terminal domain-containing protein [Renibacterium salmoninarum]|uniref:glycoside hydrolase family 38 C-terminal domain-containing protein n=1 Tax=Renibacterium salmoninarum TaxID=1646 RepID=UPI000DF7ED26|nr:glycoside hydrolase family 38 C-terminal domain-containing protein [Renibacterium salmoninarum]
MFFEEVQERHGEQIEDIAGDWNDWWGHGIGSAASEMALSRQAQSQLAQAHTLTSFGQLLGAEANQTATVNTERGYRQLALWDEHTWGAADSWLHKDHGPSAGERQWHWKAARAYEALDESQLALAQSREILAAQLDPADPLEFTVFNTANQNRNGVVDFFLSDSVLPVQLPLAVRDLRDENLLPVEYLVEQENFRSLGRTVRVALQNIPALGSVSIRVEPAQNSPATPVEIQHSDGANPYLLANEFFAVRIDARAGTVSSIFDKRAEKELVNQDAVFGFNGYVYDTYASAGAQNHNSSKQYETPGKLTLLAGRSISTAAALITSSSEALGRHLTVRSIAPGANWVESTYTLPHGAARLEIRNRVSKESTYTKESAFFAFPFAIENARVLLESAGGLAEPGAASIPGSAEYMHGIRHWARIQGAECSIGWATAEAPLVEVGTISLPYIPFPNSLPVTEPGTIYSWIHNNIWDTNFPVQQAFEMDFRYCISAGEPLSTVAALHAAADFAQPLIALPGKAAATSAELLTIESEQVQLIDVLPGNGSVVARLLWSNPDGGSCEIGLPGLVSAFRTNFLGERFAELEVLAGKARISSSGAGVLAVELRTE